MKSFASTLLRFFGFLNLLFAAYGGYLVFVTVNNVLHSHEPSQTFVRAFALATSINILFLLFLVVAGVSLIQLKPNYRKVCNWLFSSEILYFVAVFMPWEMDAWIAQGVGNMGIAPQILTAYPVIALIVINLAGRSHASQQAHTSP